MGQSCPGLHRAGQACFPTVTGRQGLAGGWGQPSLGVGVPNHQGPGLVCMAHLVCGHSRRPVSTHDTKDPQTRRPRMGFIGHNKATGVWTFEMLFLRATVVSQLHKLVRMHR